jgi:hypothetical protein
MAWTTADDVIAAWIGDDAPSDASKVDVWIGKAEREVRRRVPDLQARIDGGTEPDLLENIQDVVTAMVHRVFRNPEGVRTTSRGDGPFSTATTYGGDQPGGLYLTDDELAKLSAAGVNRGAFTIDTIPVTSPYSQFYTGTV